MRSNLGSAAIGKFGCCGCGVRISWFIKSINAEYALCTSPTILNGKPESIPAISSSVFEGNKYFSASILSTPNSWRFLVKMDWLSLSCAVSSYTGPIHLQSTVLSPSGASPNTPSGISFVSTAVSTACWSFCSYLIFCFSYFSKALGSSSFSGNSGYFIPEANANDFLKL